MADICPKCRRLTHDGNCPECGWPGFIEQSFFEGRRAIKDLTIKDFLEDAEKETDLRIRDLLE